MLLFCLHGKRFHLARCLGTEPAICTARQCHSNGFSEVGLTLSGDSRSLTCSPWLLISPFHSILAPPHECVQQATTNEPLQKNSRHKRNSFFFLLLNLFFSSFFVTRPNPHSNNNNATLHRSPRSLVHWPRIRWPDARFQHLRLCDRRKECIRQVLRSMVRPLQETGACVGPTPF